jgi:hypothetical protein
MACLVTDNELKTGSGDHTDGIVLHDGITNDNITCSNLRVLNVRGQGLFVAGDSMSNVSVRNMVLVGITNIQYESGVPTNAVTLTIEHVVLRNLTIANQDLAMNSKHNYSNCAVLDSAMHYVGVDDGILADELHAWGGTNGGDNADFRESFGDPAFTDGAYNADYDAAAVDYSPSAGSPLDGRTTYPAGTFDLDGAPRSQTAGAIGAFAESAEALVESITYTPDRATYALGATVSIHGITNWAEGTTATVQIKPQGAPGPVDCGTGTIGADGTVTISATIPTDNAAVTAGSDYFFQLTDGSDIIEGDGFTVVAAGVGGGAAVLLKAFGFGF